MNLEHATNLSEIQQWELLRAGDAVVFETVFKTHYNFLFNYCRRLHTDEDEIKDCLQILFLTLWERRAFLGSATSLRGYLLVSLRRLVLKRRRSDALWQPLDAESFQLPAELSAEAMLIDEQTSDEHTLLLQQAIGKLPDRQKEALYLKFYAGQSFPEIAEIMGISTRAVYKHIYKGLDTLSGTLRPVPSR
jgi:RNA polymerase sigma factor (sigma-70 family)